MNTTSFQGNISSLALADVLQNLATNRKTGTLTIQRDEIERHIQLLDGKIVSYGDSDGFSIAQWLRDKQLVDPQKLDQALRRHRRAKRKGLGEILNDLGELPLEEYRGYLGDLVSETLYEILSYRRGTFSFRDDHTGEKLTDPEVSRLGLELPASSVVMEGARRMDDWQNFRASIPSENEIYHVPASERERLLEQSEEGIARSAVELMDGTRTVREVIAQLPYSRFDACRCVAELVAEKKAQLLDSRQLMRNSREEVDPKQELARLKTVLEREPSNRDILSRLADLYEAQGERNQSVTHYKLLAISYLEEGDLEQGEQHLRNALRLNPRDIATWRKLWEVVHRQGDQEKMASFGSQYVAHFKKLGLLEVARDQLDELIKLFPKELKYKIELADVRFSMGDRKASINGLFDVARGLLGQRRLEEAEKVFARILKYDRGNQKAREYYEKLHSGVLAQRRAFRRRLIRRVASLLLFTAIAGFFAYDLFARTLLIQATQSMIHDEVLADGDYEEALARVKGFRDAHPYSLAANLEARVLIDTLSRRAQPATPTSTPSRDDEPTLSEAARSDKAGPAAHRTSFLDDVLTE